MGLGRHPLSTHTALTSTNHSIYRFIKGHSVLIALISMSFVLTSFMTLYYRRENARRDVVLAESGYTDEQRFEEREKGDNAMFFRYTV